MTGTGTAPAPRGRGRPPGSTAGQAVATRERIIEVAIELFAQDGFDATGVADIGARAGLRPGALYYHIGSKEELLGEILTRYTAKALDGAEEIAGSDLEPAEKLRRLIAFHVRTIAEHQREAMIQVRDGHALTGARADSLQSLRQQVQAGWERVLEQGVQTGRFRSADRAVVNGLLGMVNMLYMWYRPERGDDPQEIAARLSEMALNGLELVGPVKKRAARAAAASSRGRAASTSSGIRR